MEFEPLFFTLPGFTEYFEPFLLLILSRRYPAINKPAAVLHWLNHVETDAEFIVILDADMILRGPITPWEFKAERGRPVSTPYE